MLTKLNRPQITQTKVKSQMMSKELKADTKPKIK